VNSAEIKEEDIEENDRKMLVKEKYFHKLVWALSYFHAII